MIIGLVGFIGAGKGTVADILVEKHGFIKESFANSVKDSCAAIFGWERHMLEGDTVQSRSWREIDDPWWSEKLGRPFSPRLALQLMGTEAGRDVFHVDLWVHTVMRRISKNPNHNYVIADVRFPNEVQAIHEYGGKVIRVHRGIEPVWYSTALDVNTGRLPRGVMEENYPDVHYSEWAWIGQKLDVTITNNTTLEGLVEKVDLLVE